MIINNKGTRIRNSLESWSIDIDKLAKKYKVKIVYGTDLLFSLWFNRFTQGGGTEACNTHLVTNRVGST